MTLGEKLVQARTALGLTQTQVAGAQITRNMLSKLEHDCATPSLKTLEYLASVLKVPVSWLLNDTMMQDLSVLDEARLLFREKDFSACWDLLQKKPAQEQEEANLLRLRCSLYLAKNAMDQGDFTTAKTFAETAQQLCDGCLYATNSDRTYISWLIARNNLHDKSSAESFVHTFYAEYKSLGMEECRHILLARYYISVHNTQAAEKELWSMGDLTDHVRSEYLYLRGLVSMQKTHIRDAMLYLHQAEQENASPALLEEIYAALEACCKELEDYKRAYEYSSKRLALHLE